MSKEYIYLVVGESGSGKNAVIKEMCKNKYTELKSYTTRPKRNENEDTHTFITDEEFDKLTDICAYTEYNGYRYCATTQQCDENDFYIINPKGIKYFYEHYKGEKEPVVVYVYVPTYIRIWRMFKRGDSIKNIIQRVKNDRVEFANCASLANITINNYDLHHAVHVLSIMMSIYGAISKNNVV